MRLSWALVHSRRPEDVQRGMAMLEGEIYTDRITVLGAFPKFPNIFFLRPRVLIFGPFECV